MRARCGSCGTEVDVTGQGRFKCPTCGAVNQIPGQAAAVPGASAAPPSVGGLPPVPVPPPQPSPRVSCPDCSFSFIVGDVDMAVCPNCGAEVSVGGARDE